MTQECEKRVEIFCKKMEAMNYAYTDAFLDCGILANGFLRLRCEDCHHEKLVAFSCKRRGFCPSCGARRMAETAAHLADNVIPRQPVRQWVISFPIPLRILLASQPQLLSPVLQVIHRTISSFLIKQAGFRAERRILVPLRSFSASAQRPTSTSICIVFFLMGEERPK